MSWIAAVLITLAPLSSLADELTFREGDGGSASSTAATYILDAIAIVPPDPETLNFGSETVLLSQLQDANTQTRTLIAFPDIFGNAADQIPPGSAIVMARLALTTTASGESADTISAHFVRTSWDEDSASWDLFNEGGAPGVDYDTVPVDQLSPALADTVYELDATPAVQDWSNGDPNLGLLLVNAGPDGAAFHSDDAGTATLRPLLTVDFQPPPAATPKIYWADASLLQIESADLDGSNRAVLASNPSAAALNGVSVDPIHAVVYWIECCGSLTSRIRRANLDGTNPTTIPVSFTFGFPQRVLIDPVNQLLFWTDSASSTASITRSAADGSGTTTLHGPSSALSPVALALDPVDQKLYWTESAGTEVGIHRMNLDGSGKEPLVTLALGDEIAQAEGLAIDPIRRKMYWTDLGRDEIRRANLDGSGIEVLATAVSHGLQNPIGIAVDTVTEHLYWSDTTTDEITRANLDASGAVDIVATGLSFPRALSIVDQETLPLVQLPALGTWGWALAALSLAVAGSIRIRSGHRR